MDNKQLLQKADLVLADLTAGGGQLNPEQSDQFIRKLIEEPTMINGNLIRVVPMRASQKKIEKIGFGKRILRAATEGVALADPAVDGAFNPTTEAAARAKPTFETVNLNVKEVIAEVPITYDVMEDNIERAMAANNENMNDGPGGIRTTIIDMIAERAALDLEELALLGDESIGASDPYLDLLDGWLINAKTNGNTHDVSGASISKTVFKEGIKAMPTQYRRRAMELWNFVSKDNELEYRDTLSDRATPLGDGFTTGDRPATAYATRVEGVALMPEAEGLLTNPKNLIMGVQRKVSLEFDKDITARKYIVVLTAKVDFQIEEVDAIVHYDNIG